MADEIKPSIATADRRYDLIAFSIFADVVSRLSSSCSGIGKFNSAGTVKIAIENDELVFLWDERKYSVVESASIHSD